MTHSEPTRSPHPLEPIASELARVGAAWARYGLTVAQASLRTSARSLEGTAALLSSLADVVDPKRATGRDGEEGATVVTTDGTSAPAP